MTEQQMTETKWINHCAIGDCREVLRKMIADGVRVQMCVTSPPYWGLRDYQVDGQLGLEATIEEYIENMVEVFRLAHEVLADDGTLWIVIGDSYANDGKWGGETCGKQAYLDDNNRKRVGREKRITGLKPKDLIGIPWSLAFALRDDGWWLRSDIIWHKPNCMPESVKDRPTRAHEYIFLLSKSERYYYNHKAIQEAAQPDTIPRYLRGRSDHHKWADGGPGNQTLARSLEPMAERALARSGNKVKHWGTNETTERGDGEGVVETHRGIPWEGSTRNKRTVWTIPTEAYSEAHFATFPRKLVEPCLLAGSRVGDIVLDPFFGSGTVGQVAENLGRQWIGIDLNREYVKMSQRRTAQMGMQLE